MVRISSSRRTPLLFQQWRSGPQKQFYGLSLYFLPTGIQRCRARAGMIPFRSKHKITSSTAEAPVESRDETGLPQPYQGIKIWGAKNSKRAITLAHPQYELIQRWWHPVKNQPWLPEHFRHRSGKRIWLQCEGCPRCGEVHEWNPKIGDVTKNKDKACCPRCESRAGSFCSCRAVSTSGLLRKEWHEDNPLPPSEVSLGHQSKVKWRCSHCEHVWSSNPAFRSNDGTGCPECGKARRIRHGTVVSVRPDLVKEWDFSKNTERPDELTCGSGVPIWWKCQTCEHEWSAVIKARALNGAICPVCAKAQRFLARNFAKKSVYYS